MGFSYGPGGAVTAVTVDGTAVVAHIVYAAHGRRSLVQLGNGVLQRYLYDPNTLRLRRAHAQVATSSTPLTWTTTGLVLQDRLYRYDVDGNLSVLGDRTPGSGLPAGLDPRHPPDPDALNRIFEYDPLGRLVSATGRETDTAPLPPWVDTPRGDDVTAPRPYRETYTYDDVGNLTVLDHQGPDQREPLHAYVHFRRREQPPGQADEGRRSARSGQSDSRLHVGRSRKLLSEMDNRLFEWLHANRLATFRNQTAPDAAPTVYAMYRYDASGERVLKIVRKGHGADEVTAYLGGFERTFVGTIGGTMTAYDELHVTDHDSRLACLVRGTPHPRDPFQTELTRYQLGDRLGSVVATLDDTARMLSREEYLPYGETSFGSYARKRYRYTGKERDEESGLSYHSARYYAPWLARWASTDPEGHLDGPNLYAYARCEPLAHVDRTGTETAAPPSSDPGPGWWRVKDKGDSEHPPVIEMHLSGYPPGNAGAVNPGGATPGTNPDGSTDWKWVAQQTLQQNRPHQVP